MNNSFSVFTKKIAYNYDEILALLETNSSSSFPFAQSDDVLKCLNYVGLMPTNSSDEYVNDFALSFILIEENNLVCEANAMKLLNKLQARYGEHYAIICDTEENQEKERKTNSFFKKLFNLLDYTFNKYNLLINQYEEQKSHLLDKLGKTRSGNRSVSESGQNAENSVSLFNDTPQTTDVVATIDGNQYVSELSKNSIAGSTASSGSDNFQEAETWDNNTIMARLDEIEKQFSLLWKKWLNEFDELFIEEVNF